MTLVDDYQETYSWAAPPYIKLKFTLCNQFNELSRKQIATNIVNSAKEKRDQMGKYKSQVWLSPVMG